MAITAIKTQMTRREVVEMVRRVPKILAAHEGDVKGLASGFRARIAISLQSLIMENVETKLSMGDAGVDGTKWEPLTQEYLAYGRRWSGKNKRHPDGRVTPLAGGLWPMNKDSFMNKKQLEQWWKDYRSALSWAYSKFSGAEAKGVAAGAATNKYKAAGGQTKLWSPRLGMRQAGADYQIGRDTGEMFRSISAGRFTDSQSLDATYEPPDEQFIDHAPGLIVVGTNNKKAEWFHKSRPLWPNDMPESWWDEIGEVAFGGITRLWALFV